MQHNLSALRQSGSDQGSADILIIGNGIAGLTAAVEARRLAPSKRIAIVTEQSYPTINTPALKQFAIGKLEREQLLAYPVGTERSLGIQVIHGRVEEINAQSRFITLASGSTIGYDSLLLATGNVPAGLPPQLPGRDFDGVLMLHRLQHYLDLRRRLHEVEDAVVLGGGVHAIETVTILLRLGIQTHWLMRGKTCLTRVLDRTAADMVIRHMQQAGAKVYTESEVVGIAGSVGTVAGVVTTQNHMIPCELLLVCTGTQPATSLAEHCTLPMMYERERGIFVNNQLRTNVAGIYAAGDVAAICNPQTGKHAARAQWYSAVKQGCMAAAAMTGQHEAALQSFGVPWHATRIGELALLTVGSPLEHFQDAITLAESHKGTYRRLTILDDRLIGYISLGQTQADGLAIKQLIDEGHFIYAVQEALLKGTFDAGKYFVKQQSSLVRSLTSAKLPAISVKPSAPRAAPVTSSPLPALPGTPPILPAVRPLSSVASPSMAHIAPRLPLPASHPTTQYRSLLSYDRQRGQFLVEKGR